MTQFSFLVASAVIQQLGRYEIVAPLAKGGMGELTLARERGPAGFERLVVVKRIRPQVAEKPQVVESFLREARLVARLNHPNIVQIIELGQLEESDEYFIVMEYIEGSSTAELQVLADLLDRPLPLEVVVSIGVQACRGLEAAHDLRDAHGSRVGLIHRDVTPQNLMCTTRGFVKLLDFGVAKTTAGRDNTRSQMPRGKPAYFSPEQAQQKRLDHRTDIFSLGVVLWELAAGKSLFLRGGMFGTLRAVVDAPIPPLHDYGIDPRFDDIVRGALARDRDDRYADAARFRARLSEYAASQDWDDVHDSLSAFVSELAGDIVEGRRQKANAARSRELTDAEGKSLVHATNQSDLVATLPTLDVPPEFLEALDADAESPPEEPVEPERSPAPGEEPSDVVTPPKPRTPPPRPTSTWGVLARDAVFVVAGFSAIAAVTIAVWMRPTWLPPVAFLAIVCLPLCGWRFLGKGSRRSRWLNALPALLLGLLFLALSAGWMSSSLRSTIAGSAVALGLEKPASKALFDPAEEVARAVCAELQDSDLRLPQDVIVQKLSSTRPDAAACLIGQLDPEAASTEVVLDYLLPRWSEELRQATNADDQDVVCAKTRWMARAIRRTDRAADLSLLDCALHAEAAPARQCCTQAYRLLAPGEEGIAMTLPPAATAVESGGADVARFLTELFRGERSLAPEQQSLGLDSPGVRAWVLSVHCEILARDATSTNVDSLDALRSLVGGECRLPDEIAQERAVWTSSCQRFFARHRFWEATGDESRLLCREIADGVGAVTRKAARSRVETAMREAIAVDEPGRTRAEKEALQRQCLQGQDAEICRKLGISHQQHKRFEDAFEFYETGCEAGDPTSCNSAGYLLATELPVSTPDRERALEFYERACTMGVSIGCANQAEELRRGRFTERDLKRARQIYSAQCEKGSGYACGGLATMYWDGEGVPRAPDKAIEYWQRGCDEGYAQACIDLALDARTLDERPPGVPAETFLLRKGCLVHSKKLCLRDMGYRYLVGRNTPLDEDRARRHFEWACELGDEKSCERIDR